MFLVFGQVDRILFYLPNQVQAQMVFDVPPQPLREVVDHLTLVDSSHGCPPLPLVIPNPMPERHRQVPPPHPPLYIPHLQLHSLFLWRGCMQEHLCIFIIPQSFHFLTHEKKLLLVQNKMHGPLVNIIDLIRLLIDTEWQQWKSSGPLAWKAKTYNSEICKNDNKLYAGARPNMGTRPPH